MVKVVPRLVEHRAAPEAKACKGVAPSRDCRRNESPIGIAIPVSATPVERPKFAFNALKDVARPPRLMFSESPTNVRQELQTFIHEQDKAEVAKLDNSHLNLMRQPFCTRCSPCNPEKDLTD